MIVKSESGDWFEIPAGQEHEYKLYRSIVGNHEEMMRYETGQTGWIYRPDLD